MLKKVMLIALVAGVFTSCSSPQEKLVESYYENQQQENLQEAGFAMDFSSMSQKYEVSEIISDVTYKDSIIQVMALWSKDLSKKYSNNEITLEDYLSNVRNSIEKTRKSNSELEESMKTIPAIIKKQNATVAKAKKAGVSWLDYYELEDNTRDLESWVRRATPQIIRNKERIANNTVNYIDEVNRLVSLGENTVIGKKFDVTIVTSIPTVGEVKVVNTFFTDNDYTEVFDVKSKTGSNLSSLFNN